MPQAQTMVCDLESPSGSDPAEFELEGQSGPLFGVEDESEIAFCHRGRCGRTAGLGPAGPGPGTNRHTMASFQQVRSVAPNSRFATASTSWIDLLQASSSGLSFLNIQSPGVPKVTEDFVWEALERELDGANESVRSLFSERAKRVGELTDRRPVTSQNQATSPKDTAQATVQALHKRLHERERTLAERDQQIHIMSSQLDALKRIDQDIRDRRRPLRPSVTVAP